MRKISLWLLLLGVAVASATPFHAADPTPQPAPPVLGWGTWNSFGNAYDARTIEQQAHALVSTGMAAAGYRYVLLDEGWWLGRRDAQGKIVVDPKQWPALAAGETPGDMTNIVRYLHAMGLKAGIYTDAGADGCSYIGPDSGPPEPNTGSLGHYRQDFLQFAKWGFDYVKVDWCGGDKPNYDPARQYEEIARAIGDAERATGHQLTFSICDWGRQRPWSWAPGIGGLTHVLWRTGGDITDPIVNDALPKHQERRVGLTNLLRCFDEGLHPEAQHTGYTNDLDMLVVGMRGTTATLDRMHMALWAIAGAPLLAGADLTRLTPAQVAALTNPEVLAIDQDAAGLQGYRVQPIDGQAEVYVKQLAAPGERAVLLLNRSDHEEAAVLDAQTLVLAEGSFHARDVWLHKEIAHDVRRLLIHVPPHAPVLLRIAGSEPKGHMYAAARVAQPALCAACSVEVARRSSVAVKGVAGDGRMTVLHIHYRNPLDRPEVVQVQVNDGQATRLQLPPTGSAGEAVVAMEAMLSDGRANRITFERDAQSEWTVLGVEAPEPRNLVAAESGSRGSAAYFHHE